MRAIRYRACITSGGGGGLGSRFQSAMRAIRYRVCENGMVVPEQAMFQSAMRAIRYRVDYKGFHVGAQKSFNPLCVQLDIELDGINNSDLTHGFQSAMRAIRYRVFWVLSILVDVLFISFNPLCVQLDIETCYFTGKKIRISFNPLCVQLDIEWSRSRFGTGG